MPDRLKVLFSNPPWWVDRVARRRDDGTVIDGWIAGVRAGSRWPFTSFTRSAPDRFVYGDYLPYPFFMGYAAPYVARETGAEVTFRDSIALRESYESYLGFVRDGRFRYVFIESASPSWPSDLELIRAVKTVSPDSRIVVTGPIATFGESLLADAPVHAVIRGEYEKGAVRVVEGAAGVIDYDLLTPEEMNAAPFPHFASDRQLRYYDRNPAGQTFPHAQVWSSRGCPYKCIFCVWPATMTANDPDGTGKRRIRQYSQDYMAAFLGDLARRLPVRTIYFDDDTFNIGNGHVLRMCAVMEKVGLPWTAMCRADTIHLDTWKAMREAGCVGVKIGFESGNQHVVDTIVNKRLDLEQAREVVHHLKRLGMTVHGTFTYGLPGETVEQMRDTKRYIASLPLDTVQESGTAEIEGTPLSRLTEKGLAGYAGACRDEDYERASDGAVKMRRIAERLAGGDAETGAPEPAVTG